MSVSTEGNFSDIKTPVTPEWRPYSVPTAFYKIAERRGARCAVTSNAVCALCNRLEHHAAGVLSMLKINAAAWRLHSVLDSALRERCWNAVGTLWGLLKRHGRVVGAPRARCQGAV